jgi:Ca-activated chloride channel homolog
MRKILLIIMILFFGTVNGHAASQARDVKNGNVLYKKGDYAASIEKYNQALKKAPESDIINFDLGTAYYKNGDYGKTIAPLQKSLLADDVKFKQNAYYNLGNAFYKFGLTQEKGNVNAAISSLEQSLAQYESALKIAPKDEDAKFNYDIVKKELERLKQKKQEQQKQNQQQKQQDQSQQQSQQSSQQKQESQKSSAGEQNQEKQQGGQEKEEEGKKEESQEKKEQAAGQKENKEEKSPQEQASGQTASGPMTKKEAQELLNNYQENEEPKGLPNFSKREGTEAPVAKDW